jgi:hypothetical protein
LGAAYELVLREPGPGCDAQARSGVS